MATVTKIRNSQGSTEIKVYPCDFTGELLTGVTVASATATHTPPSGAATSPTVTVSSPYVYVTAGTLTALGVHYVSVLATLTNGEKAEIVMVISVDH
jgi:hypothetical protein